MTFEDPEPAPAPVVAVAAAAFAPPANPRSSQIQKAVRHAAVVAAFAPQDPKGYFDLAEQQVARSGRLGLHGDAARGLHAPGWG